MTYQEFKDTDYTIDVAAWYAAIDAEPAADVRNALIQHITTYKMMDTLRVLEASKAANKPIHYKVVNNAIAPYNDERIRVYISSEWLCKTIRAKFDHQYDINRIYLNVNDNNVIDWDCPINEEFRPRTIEDIRNAVEDIIYLNKHLKDDISSLKKRYNEELERYADIAGVPRLWVEVKG